MHLPMQRNKSVDVHQFTMIPRADIPRSVFDVQSTHKTTFDSGYLVPIYVDEVLPGDSHSLRMSAFARLSTPIKPIMDNLYLETQFWFVPIRLVWTHWVNMMGEQDNPGDTISYTTPQCVSPAGGYAINSLQDYMGLPTVGQVTGGATVKHSAFWTRAYNLIWNQWYRDENLQNSVTVDKGDADDNAANYVLLRRGKRKDYFTSGLPWPQKGATAVSLPLGTSATVKTSGTRLVTGAQSTAMIMAGMTTGNFPAADNSVQIKQATGGLYYTAAGGGVVTEFLYPTNLYADLTTATAATINQIRQAFQIQKVLERDARGGTRYTEILQAHFQVRSPDARLQRPEYLGGGSTPILVNPIPQTSGTGLTGGTTPIGELAAIGTAQIGGHGFTQSFTEHGVILGLASVRADLTYQQGMRRMWSRTTRYDYYLPAFAALGEQTILNKEIYAVGSATGGITPGDQDMNVFAYQERWAELRYMPSLITGLFRSTAASTIDIWHLSQKFTALPTLNTTFIQDTPPLQRVLAVGAGAAGKEIIFDSFFRCRKARPLPMFSVPGLMDHF